MTLRDLSTKLSHIGRKRLLVPIGVVVVIAGLIAGLVFGGGGSTKSATTRSTGSTAVPTTTTSTLPYLGPYRCPLTDLSAPSGAPLRPAIAVKVGNEPGGGVPQSGLDEADVVYDTPAEGFVMRYIMVFQCNNASLIGPNRSARWVDRRIVRQLGDPILAFAGGIDPNINAIMASKWLFPANLLQGASQAGIRTTNRSAPDNLYTSTQALYGLYPKANMPPRPIFRYTPSLPAGATPAASAKINFSYDTDVVWTWNASINSWVHSYSGVPDIDALSNEPVTTTNIVIQIVKYKFGPYSEHGCCSGDFESATTGSGPGYVLRNGKAIKVTWNRPDFVAPTTYTDARGQLVGMAPGRTWVELVPNTTAAAKGALTITP